MQEREHIELFFKDNYTRLYYFAYKLLVNKEVAEDVVHDVFVKLINQKALRNNELQLKSYVFTAIRNACFNIIRHNQVQRKFADSFPDDALIEEDKGLELIIRAEVVGQIYHAIETLPEGCKSILKLAYFESLNNEQIAAQLGISINTVKSQKARALQLLRFRLGTSLFLVFLCLYSR